MPSTSPVISDNFSLVQGRAQNRRRMPTTMTEAAAKAKAARRALQQLNNQRVPLYFTVAIAGLVMMFIILRWTRITLDRHASRPNISTTTRAANGLFRKFRYLLNRPARGFTSVGHLVLVLAYLAINIALTVTNIDWSSLIGIAKRCGWMAITNTAFITFLALKNTPLAYLITCSHERLNQLHQIGGYTTVTYVFLHLILMCETFNQEHFIEILLEVPQIHAIVAASAILVILVTAITVRKLSYELFYLTHITMFMLFVINVGFHRPDFALKTIIITIFTACLWSSDRILRLCRILWYIYQNKATITPLPNGGTRIVLRRSPSRASPGTHCFLWIPRIRLGETHPFTIVSATPHSLELVVTAYDGFTKDLHKHAMLHPGASLRASIDGPYGAIPEFSNTTDKVILIAGGSGASFTFGVALDMIKKLGNSSKTTIDFIWAVKTQESLSWFAKELSELQGSPLVTTLLHRLAESTIPHFTDTSFL
ncbi:Ferric-chelate reductase 2 [Hyphodiscus hymeniophilus]|uniref:ferric-chelate reductase (NADPH) n=1 Tax=Hyphodiscus hymeniophilus TaxID=353542 RepID=A0A9P6VFD4_9HELO|nr:Ferric-chelate reductase 2 [Hyphodiscus hymeniophilus]